MTIKNRRLNSMILAREEKGSGRDPYLAIIRIPLSSEVIYYETPNSILGPSSVNGVGGQHPHQELISD